MLTIIGILVLFQTSELTSADQTSIQDDIDKTFLSKGNAWGNVDWRLTDEDDGVSHLHQAVMPGFARTKIKPNSPSGNNGAAAIWTLICPTKSSQFAITPQHTLYKDYKIVSEVFLFQPFEKSIVRLAIDTPAKLSLKKDDPPVGISTPRIEHCLNPNNFYFQTENEIQKFTRKNRAGDFFALSFIGTGKPIPIIQDNIIIGRHFNRKWVTSNLDTVPGFSGTPLFIKTETGSKYLGMAVSRARDETCTKYIPNRCGTNIRLLSVEEVRSLIPIKTTMIDKKSWE